MIKRKMQELSQKPEKPKTPRKKAIKIDLDSLPDAVVDGKLVATVGTNVLFERTRSGVTRIHKGYITEICENGMVHLFDETVEQCYAFSMNQELPKIKIVT